MDQNQRRESEVKKLKDRFRRDLREFLWNISDATRDQLHAAAIFFMPGWASGRKLKQVELRVGKFLHGEFQELAISIARDVYRDRHEHSFNN